MHGHSQRKGYNYEQKAALLAEIGAGNILAGIGGLVFNYQVIGQN